MPQPFKIETIQAFLSTDKDGVEGVCGWLMPDNTFMPLVCADPDRVKSLRPMAAIIAKSSKRRVTLAQFSVRTDLEDIEP